MKMVSRVFWVVAYRQCQVSMMFYFQCNFNANLWEFLCLFYCKSLGLIRKAIAHFNKLHDLGQEYILCKC